MLKRARPETPSCIHLPTQPLRAACTFAFAHISYALATSVYCRVSSYCSLYPESQTRERVTYIILMAQRLAHVARARGTYSVPKLAARQKTLHSAMHAI